MTKHPIEVITSVERRRRWSREDKERLVAACLEPDAVLSEIARSADIHVSQLFRWRKDSAKSRNPGPRRRTLWCQSSCRSPRR
ncbi:transposase [Pararhizobium sp. O133]|uniref:transposase n=1 Tax=Pararhizobium sp. O133 TaxID=3449278 RepID=UPI003F685571